MAIKALLVDYGGTLVREDETVLKDICRGICESSPMSLTQADVVRYWWERTQAAYLSSFGKDFIPLRELEYRVLEETLGHFQAKLDPQDVYTLLLRARQSPETFPDARMFLINLPMPVTVMHNADRDDFALSLRRTQLNAKELFCSQDARAYKPRGDFFRAAAEAMALQPKEILVIGDSLTYDIQPAHKEGFLTAWVNRTARPVPGDCPADAVFSSLSRLRNEMERSGRK